MSHRSAFTPTTVGPLRSLVPHGTRQIDHAVTAMAVLVARYARLDTIEMQVNEHPVTLALGDQMAGEAVAHRGNDALLKFEPHDATLLLSWREPTGDPSADALVLALTPENDRWCVDLERSQVRGLLACEDPMAHIARHFDTVVGELSADPDMPLAALPLVDAAERALLLGDLHQSEVVPALATPALLHRLFADSVAAHADHIAVEHGDVRLSYAQLDARATRLAAGLSARGIGSGATVAMKMRRSPEATG